MSMYLRRICIILIVVSFFLAFRDYKGNFAYEEGLENVGTIKQSLLKPTQFYKTQKGTWEILRGQELDRKSELFKLLSESGDQNVLTLKNGNYYLPNALGTFIRCSNVNGSGVDSQMNRLVGSFQDDQIKSHFHKYTSGQRKDVSGRGSRSNFAWGSQTYTTTSVGGKETRPKNISMYTYIKISN
jgi:hypothetical protein